MGVKSERRSPHHANEANNKGETLEMDYLGSSRVPGKADRESQLMTEGWNRVY